VPLGADDVQAAELLHELPLGLHPLALLDFSDQLHPFVLRHVEASGVFILQERPGHCLRVAAEDDVRTAAGHVRGDRDCALAARLGHDLGFALVMLGVEHFVLDAALLQEPRQPLALLDRHRAHEYRAAGLLDQLDLLRRDQLRLPAFGELNLDARIILPADGARDDGAIGRFDARPAVSSAIALNFSGSLR
jgi:hypothetical protein